ncbi:MAG: hypothetical protein QM754_08155 [Tepidisphaeraceae bacterium]
MRHVFALAAAVISSATLAYAQSQPAAPQTSTPYWNPQQAASDLPATDIRNVPVAHAQAVRAMGEFQQSLHDLNNGVRLVQMQQDRDPVYLKAITDEKTSYDAMNKAREAALASLQNNSSYTANEKLHKELVNKIADEQFAPKPDPVKLEGMARLKLQYIKDNRKLETSVLDRDQAFQDARAKYLEAAAKVSQLRGDQAFAVATDPALIALRRQVAQARIEKTASNVFWQDSVTAANIAINYAYYYRSFDKYQGGYGYPGYYGYGGYRYGAPYRY